MQFSLLGEFQNKQNLKRVVQHNHLDDVLSAADLEDLNQIFLNIYQNKRQKNGKHKPSEVYNLLLPMYSVAFNRKLSYDIYGLTFKGMLC